MSLRTSEPTEIHRMLTAMIKTSGRNQAELARRAGFSQKHVSEMMTGKVDGSLDAWEALLDAAGIWVKITSSPDHMTITIRSLPGRIDWVEETP